MPSMRVHELAKEFNLSSKEMLDKAVGKIHDLMNTDIGPLVEDKSNRVRERVSRSPFQTTRCLLTRVVAKMARGENTDWFGEY